MCRYFYHTHQRCWVFFLLAAKSRVERECVVLIITGWRPYLLMLMWSVCSSAASHSPNQHTLSGLTRRFWSTRCVRTWFRSCSYCLTARACLSTAAYNTHSLVHTHTFHISLKACWEYARTQHRVRTLTSTHKYKQEINVTCNFYRADLSVCDRPNPIAPAGLTVLTWVLPCRPLNYAWPNVSPDLNWITLSQTCYF